MTKNQKVLNEDVLKEMIRTTLMEEMINQLEEPDNQEEPEEKEGELNEDVDEGLFGTIAGGLLGKLAKPLLGKLCDKLGIQRDGVLGKMMMSDAVIMAICGTAGNMVGDKIGGPEFMDNINNSKAGKAINGFFGGGETPKAPALTAATDSALKA